MSAFVEAMFVLLALQFALLALRAVALRRIAYPAPKPLHEQRALRTVKYPQ